MKERSLFITKRSFGMKERSLFQRKRSFGIRKRSLFQRKRSLFVIKRLYGTKKRFYVLGDINYEQNQAKKEIILLSLILLNLPLEFIIAK